MKEFSGSRSWFLSDQVVGPLLRLYRLGHPAFRACRISQFKWGGVPLVKSNCGSLFAFDIFSVWAGRQLKCVQPNIAVGTCCLLLQVVLKVGAAAVNATLVPTYQNKRGHIPETMNFNDISFSMSDIFEFKRRNINTNWKIWCINSAVDFCLEGIRFITRPEQQLFCQFFCGFPESFQVNSDTSFLSGLGEFAFPCKPFTFGIHFTTNLCSLNIWYGIWFDMIYNMIWYYMIYDMIWYMIWYDMI